MHDECEGAILRTLETMQADNAPQSVSLSLIVSRLDDQYSRKAIRTAMWRLKFLQVIDTVTPPNKMEQGGSWWWLSTKVQREQEQPLEISGNHVGFLDQFTAMFPNHPFVKDNRRTVKSIPASGK